MLDYQSLTISQKGGGFHFIGIIRFYIFYVCSEILLLFIINLKNWTHFDIYFLIGISVH